VSTDVRTSFFGTLLLMLSLINKWYLTLIAIIYCIFQSFANLSWHRVQVIWKGCIVLIVCVCLAKVYKVVFFYVTPNIFMHVVHNALDVFISL
jgi:hypothetical protein